MMATLKRMLFREPRAGGMAGWLYYVIACGSLALGGLVIFNGLFLSDFSSTGGPSYNPALLVLGSMFVLQAAAELLPKGWGTAAGFLRVGSICVAVVGFLLILVF